MSVPASMPAAVLLADSFDMHGDLGTGWWIVMMVGMAVFWALVILGAIWVVREVMHSRNVSSGVETPAAMLDRRFATGEISVEEYRERKAVLSGETPPH